MHILLVEDSVSVGRAMKSLLNACGADITGPVATTTEAYHLIAERNFDAALVHINLRGGERADGLIDRLHSQGVRVVVTAMLVMTAPNIPQWVKQKGELGNAVLP